MEKIKENPLNKGDTLFNLSLNQYKQYIDFLEEHKPCRIAENRYHRFGAIGGGYSITFKLKNKDGTLEKTIYTKCVGCGKKIKISDSYKINEDCDLEDLKLRLESFNKYTTTFNGVELERFNKIFEKNNGNVEVSFAPTGLGCLINVNGEDITDNTNW